MVASTQPLNIAAGILNIRFRLYAGHLTLGQELKRNGQKEHLAIRLGKGDCAKTAYFLKTDERIRILLVSLETPGQAARSDLLPEDRAFETLSTSKLSEVIALLHKLALEAGGILRAGVYEVREDEAPGEVPGLFHAVTAGLPPPLLIRDGEFSFPLRSGIPAGIVSEWMSQTQSMEWHEGDALYVHTDTADSQTPQDFHEYLRSHAGDSLQIPEDMILFRIEFGA